MAGKIKEGQSVYIPFVDGESALDSHFSTRVYSSPSQFRKNYRDGDNPTLVEYAPVVHGRWEFHILKGMFANDPRCMCSECGSLEAPLARHKYCPNCGAKMDLEADDE